MPALDQRRLIAVSDAAALAQTAAQRLVVRIEANAGRIAICLTGGSTPKRLYALLATKTYRDRIPWQRVHWFIGDERFVAPDDPLHNMAMARGIFLDRCAPAANIHPMPTDTAGPDESARLYERELKTFYGADRLEATRPLFDVVLLGVGPDGHVASLFPGTAALGEHERWAVGVGKAPVEPYVVRVTLSLPVLGSCREMLFEVAGAEKRAILTRVLGGEKLPANLAHATGETVWLIERDALPGDFGGQ